MGWGAKCYTSNSLPLKFVEIEQLEICLCNYVRVWIANEAGICVQTWVPCTVHGTRKFFNKANVTSKLGPMGTIHNLKIFLLQYFQQ